MRGFILLLEVESELTKDALVADVRQLFMRHAPHVVVHSATASLYLELEVRPDEAKA